MDKQERARVRERIRELNDAFREYPWNDARALGRTVVTAGVNANGPEFVLRALNAVAGFDAFTPDNDPHGEHDFGSLELDGETLFFKIDYYDSACRYGSEDPGDPSRTTRVLTIMLSSEY